MANGKGEIHRAVWSGWNNVAREVKVAVIRCDPYQAAEIKPFYQFLSNLCRTLGFGVPAVVL